MNDELYVTQYSQYIQFINSSIPLQSLYTVLLLVYMKCINIDNHWPAQDAILSQRALTR